MYTFLVNGAMQGRVIFGGGGAVVSPNLWPIIPRIAPHAMPLADPGGFAAILSSLPRRMFIPGVGLLEVIKI